MGEAGTRPAGNLPAGNLPLLLWLSPAFPVGAYAYSHGLEWAVETGDVRTAADLTGWLYDCLHAGVGRNDAVLAGVAHRATASNDREALHEANDLALAFAPSAELRLETAQQGRSFLDTVLAAWPAPGLTDEAERFGDIAFPVAVGLASAAHRIARPAMIDACLVSLTQNLVSAAIRLAPIGQMAGQRVLAELLPGLVGLAAATDTLGLDDLGSATLRADCGSLRHETQYTRIFRS